ncbi:Uncharacterized protein conserved in bacteria, putative lipoprotein [Legionella lansingensis]|uniref:Lysozyme inhibitor LprI-like N-terminal domain-containing protein n=1 Tax=Legionella lansingensis TaxID=45067 RepID=A0A0W0VIE4_9GAMM|nr:lysozyme inhibitor LprI family protein [Legionella lansingensis]KTD19606.1 hypothetical protein Llan_2068 [Legionella lansingensis]SNV50208.1 Uncharacterized protein conserved in bacteria, putative lipoprotein [Legionella lansingensis]
MPNYPIFSISLSLWLLIISFTGKAASFECKKNQTPVEKLICNSSKLGILDSYMSLLYHQLSDTTSPDTKKNLLDSQKKWLTERNNCQTASCLVQAYEKRISDLMTIPLHSSLLKDQKLEGKWLADFSHQYASSELNITQENEEGFKFSISATNGGNTGEIEGGNALFIGNDAIAMVNNSELEIPCQILFRLINKKLTLESNNSCNYYAGNGVIFDGNYVKDGQKKLFTLKEAGFLDTNLQELQFKKMTGKDYLLFVNNCGLATDSDEKSTTPEASVRYGYLRGVGQTDCIILLSNNDIWAAAIDNNQIKYFTNDVNYKDRLPSAILDWVKQKSAQDFPIIYSE